MNEIIFFFRWFQNSKVQKVVKDSKMLSKVRTSIKVRLNKPVAVDPAAEDKSNPSSDPKKGSGESDESLPSMIGSMEEYAKIVGKSVEAIQVRFNDSFFLNIIL